MKLSNVFLFASAASLSYQIVKNRHKIKQEITEVQEEFSHIQASLNNIQKNVDFIRGQEDNLKNMAQDLSYKFKVLEQDANARLNEIKEIWENSKLNLK